MPRKILIRTAELPYHITNRSNNRESFYLNQEALWSIFLGCLEQLKIQFHCEIHSFVLMSNHFHLIISTPRSNIGEAMKYLHREVAKRSNKEAQRINHFFGGRYKWSVIEREDYFWNCLKYVFRNPVRAGICNSVEDYLYSSLNRKPHDWSWDLSDIYHPNKLMIVPDRDWLNTPFNTEIEEKIRRGFRRREFTPPETISGRKTYTEEKLFYEKGTYLPKS